ncbi:MAG: TIM barrel protein [Kiritimatiellia bacterium]
MSMQPNILFDLFFKDLPLAERMGRIAATGWRLIETWKGGDAEELKQIGAACQAHNMRLVSIVMKFGADKAVAPVRAESRAAFVENIDRYSDNALAVGCKAGIVTTGDRVNGLDYYKQKANLIEALRSAAEVAEKKGFQLNVEPLNDKVDHPGYYLTSREEAIDVVRQVGSPNVKVLYDLYHQQIMAGDHTAFLLDNLKWVGHFHAAGVPGRHEVFAGELNYPYVIRRIREAGYAGTFGLEYFPSQPDEQSLRETWNFLGPAFS